MTQQPSKQLPDMPPQPQTLLGESPNFADLLAEVKMLRLYVGNLVLSVRAMREYLQENFHATYNRLDSLDNSVDSINETISIITEE